VDIIFNNLSLGARTFKSIITNNMTYVDKTKEILLMIKNYDFCFLTRPRRFGKTLLLDTAREVFRGNGELFKDLEIFRLGYDFSEKHPVVKISVAYGASGYPGELRDSIIRDLHEAAEFHGVEIDPGIKSMDVGWYLKDLATKLWERDKAGAVILIDECDGPLAGYIGTDTEAAEANRDILRDFYTALDAVAGQIRFTLVTGAAGFALNALDYSSNNYIDISLYPEFSGICGFTVSEFDRFFGDRLEGILLFLKGRDPENWARRDVNALRDQILAWYGGYDWNGPEKVLNPWSTLNFLDSQIFGGYWVPGGLPIHLDNLIRKRPMDFLMPRLDGYRFYNILNKYNSSLLCHP
jgi:hypothetical protein